MALSQPTTTGFQQVVNINPGVGEAGDFWGANPRATLLAGPGIWVAPAGGLLVGQFCWANQATGLITQGYTAGAQIGFVHRENQALIVNFLGFSTMLIPAGLAAILHSQGDFWAQFFSGCTPGQYVYADPITGAVVGGTSVGAATWAGTGYIVAGTAGWTGTGYIVGNTLTVTSTITGTIAQWQTITLTSTATGENNTDIGLSPGKYLTAGSGTSWTVSGNAQNVGSAGVPVALTGTSASQFTASTTSSGTLAVGGVLSGTGIIPGTTILAGTGPYSVTGQQTAFSSGTPGTINAGGAILIPWYVNSYANPGELAVISTWG